MCNMKNRHYSTASKIIAAIIQQIMAVLFVMFLFFLVNLADKSMLEIREIGTTGNNFLSSEYYTQELKKTTTEVQHLIALQKEFETEGEYDPTKPIYVNADICYQLGDMISWAEEGCKYQAAGYLSLVEESYPAMEDGGYIERYLNGEISTEEAISISNSIEKTVSGITEQINDYKRLVNKYDLEKSNVYYYYEMESGQVYSNFMTDSEEIVEERYGTDRNTVMLFGNSKEEAKKKMESLGSYLSYDDQDVRFTTNVEGLEEYFYNDMNYITGNMDSNSVLMVGIDTSFPQKDHFYEARLTYYRLHPWIRVSMVMVAVALVGWIISVIYLSTVSGKGFKEDEIHLNFVDKMKTEFLIFLGILFLVGNIFVLGAVGSLEWEMSGIMIMAGSLAFIGNAIFMVLYLSLVRRTRAGTLWSNSIIYALTDLLQQFYKKRKTTGRFVFFYLAGAAVVLILAAMGYYYSQPLFLLVLILVIAAAGVVLLKEQLQRQEIMDGIEEIKSGNLEFKIDTEQLTGVNKTLSEGINTLGEGLEKAVDTSMKNERMKADLITNVSHDIKTPLTSIINYVNLLENENIEDEKIRNYIHILNEKSARLRQLTEDLVEASKISSGNITLEMTKINLVELIYQTSGEFNEKFETRNLTVVTKLPKESVVIMADGRRIWRVLENLYNNVAKYALEGTRVYVELDKQEEKAVFSIKNISFKPLNIPSEELTERFIRGDVSRTTEGSGLGLSIAQNLTKLMGGKFDIILDGDLFKVTITFPLAF